MQVQVRHSQLPQCRDIICSHSCGLCLVFELAGLCHTSFSQVVHNRGGSCQCCDCCSRLRSRRLYCDLTNVSSGGLGIQTRAYKQERLLNRIWRVGFDASRNTVEIVRTNMDRKVRKTCASSEIVVVRDSQGQMRLCLLVKSVPKDKAGGPT